MFKNNRKINKAYTLTEIIVVIIVVSALASVAIPKFTSTLEKSRAAEGVQLLDSLLSAQRAFFTQNNSYANDPNQLDINVNNSTYFSAAGIVLRNDASAVAQITRSNSSYSLTIDSNGAVACASSTSGLCKKLGF